MTYLPSVQTFDIIKSILLRLAPLFSLVYFSAAFGDPIVVCQRLNHVRTGACGSESSGFDSSPSPGLSGSHPPSPINQNRYSPD